MLTATSTFPGYRRQIQDLVKQHLELVDEPLLLAVYYAPQRDEDHLFLLEVLDNFEGSSIEPDDDLLEVTYGATPDFPLPEKDSRLHILLCNEEELRNAREGRTRRFEELRRAFSGGHAEIVYVAAGKEHLKELLQ
jgi:hypothetical protein